MSSDEFSDDKEFIAIYECYSSAFLTDNERRNVENGGKILIPQAALEHLVEQTNLMLFKLTNTKMNCSTHCGVFEFIQSEEPICYLPYWMMKHLKLNDGDELCVRSISPLPIATFVRFQPQSKEFLDISNPRAVLEHVLRGFTCLTKGDMIPINYLDRTYELCVLELKPSNAVSIIECDMEVDFAPSIDSIDDKQMQPTANTNEQNYVASTTFRPFSGQGNRLDGKVKSDDNNESKMSNNNEDLQKRGIPNYNYRYGLLQFPRIPLCSINNTRNEILDKNSASTFQPFTGKGKNLRQDRNEKPN